MGITATVGGVLRGQTDPPHATAGAALRLKGEGGHVGRGQGPDDENAQEKMYSATTCFVLEL